MCIATVAASTLSDLEDRLGKGNSTWWSTIHSNTTVIQGCVAHPPLQFDMPQVTPTPEMTPSWILKRLSVDEPMLKEPTGPIYYIVVEGTTAAAAGKFEVTCSRERVAVQLVHELMSSDSDIFVAGPSHPHLYAENAAQESIGTR